jgi:hypothetical protein
MTIERKCKTCLHWNPNQSVEPKILDENGEPERKCWNENMGGIRDDDFTCEHHLADTDYQINLPNHTPKGTMTDPNPNPVNGATEVLIVSYSKDLEWLMLALRCMEKYLLGFQGVTIAHPNDELHLFEPLTKRFNFVRLHGYDDVKGKGMLMHMCKMAEADLFLLPTTKYVLTCDSDCMYKMHTTPEHYFWNDKPYCIVRSWESLTKTDPHNPNAKVVSDCLQWRQPTDIQLGFKSDVFGMCMNTVLFPWFWTLVQILKFDFRLSDFSPFMWSTSNPIGQFMTALCIQMVLPRIFLQEYPNLEWCQTNSFRYS